MRFSHGWMADTHPDALRVFLEIQSRLTSEQKVRRMAEMYEKMIALQEDEVRKLYPHADDREVFLRVTSRRLGPELMKAVYGWQADD